MSDFIIFDAGADELNDNGFPATTYFLLSTKAVGTEQVGEHQSGDTLAGGVGEIAGTGYARKSQATPASAARAVAFAQMSWATGAAVDWPAGVKSIVAVTTADATGKALCAWNLQTGGAARDLSGANTTENVQPTYQL